MASRSNNRRLGAVLAWLVAAPSLLAAQQPAPPTPLRLSFAAAVRAASAQADGSRAERGATVEVAAQTAAMTYLGAARAAAVVAARRADSSIAAELVTLAEAQKQAGVSAALDVTRARTQLVTAEGLLIVARNELDRGRIAIARALAIDPATSLELADTLAAGLGTADVPRDRQAAVVAALEARRDLREQVAAEVDAALLDLRSAEAQQVVAAERLRLAADELAQARERFKAGVAGNIEVIDAQSNLIRARDTDIDARFAAASARVALARAVGVASTLH